MKRLTCTLALAALAAGCATDHALSLRNQTGVPLTFCPVVTDPPPPHRVVSGLTVADTFRKGIDVEGFNPIFWDPDSGLGILVQLALAEDPPMILAVVNEHQVPPGDEGSDPALQPVKLAAYPYEVDPDDEDMSIVIRAGAIDQGIPITILEN